MSFNSHKIWLLASIVFALVANCSAQLILSPTQVGNSSLQGFDQTQNTYNGHASFLTVNYGNSVKNVGLLRFNLSGISGPVASAKLELFHAYNSLGSADFALYRNESAWTSPVLSWASLPAIDSAPAADLHIADYKTNVMREWDITSLVNGWISGAFPNYGVTLERTDADNPDAYFVAVGGLDLAGKVQLPGPTLVINGANFGAVPEPSTYGLVGAALLLVWAGFRRLQKR